MVTRRRRSPGRSIVGPVLVCLVVLLVVAHYRSTRGLFRRSWPAVSATGDRPKWLPCECFATESPRDDVYNATINCTEDHAFAPEGLIVHFNYLDSTAAAELSEEIQRFPFQPYYYKHCQEFGMNFSLYVTRSTQESIPPVMAELAQRLLEDRLMLNLSNYVLVNRYQPGEGIHQHADDMYYEDGIATISLDSAVAMQFRDGRNGVCRAMFLPAGALVRMLGPSRYLFEHSMPLRGFDVVDGMRVPRRMRTAVTFRVIRPNVVSAKKAGIPVDPLKW